jgi:hypothetical protein
MARIDGLFGDDSMWRMEIWSSSYFIVSIGRWGLDLMMEGMGFGVFFNEMSRLPTQESAYRTRRARWLPSLWK